MKIEKLAHQMALAMLVAGYSKTPIDLNAVKEAPKDYYQYLRILKEELPKYQNQG